MSSQFFMHHHNHLLVHHHHNRLVHHHNHHFYPISSCTRRLATPSSPLYLFTHHCSKPFTCVGSFEVKNKQVLFGFWPKILMKHEIKDNPKYCNSIRFDGRTNSDVLKRLDLGRDYENVENERQKAVAEFYRLNHINQTYAFVKRMREEYGKLEKAEMSIWECIDLLNHFVDDSDPDLDEPQIEHLLQSAEAIRKDYPNEDWLHLTALIHDLGKVLLHPSFGALPQWSVVGDTFPLGCAFDESIVHHKYFKDNPDSKNPAYQTKTGIYTEGCGFENVLMSWGHDDYMYMVAKKNGTTLPSAALFIIRYHSFYALHRAGSYQYLMNE
ncbi:Inositol oxygenase [Quillaja saponaria]|uniref:Inositol oxygenase n=1 Tax=Quillaja saponaria TaxID=32244 RepID=A0AAD7VNJ9_QUISA|nr:Inositol oxygenase [Quillaja saponaria]